MPIQLFTLYLQRPAEQQLLLCECPGLHASQYGHLHELENAKANDDSSLDL